MITLISTFAVLGFYMLYSTSKRAELTFKYKFQHSINQNEKTAKYLALIFFTSSLFLSIITLGISSGIFSFLIVLMTVGSLVVLLAPLHFFNLPILIFIMMFCFVTEIFLT
ncbi:hypothetical protein ACFFU1_14835 [Algibacter miyuki]|uniref:Uncharacterized protein n=1 Tax=Algibacter miyuki TaxID=1306933 RepID=A0ABV5H2R5_9FLAO|nr:hypothetical protein [Algibacter miyuki]MDN3663863.1 hypothetical protein [Algibacter miyuki]